MNVREEGLQRSLRALLCLLRCRGGRWDLDVDLHVDFRPRQTRPAVCRAGRGVRRVRGEVWQPRRWRWWCLIGSKVSGGLLRVGGTPKRDERCGQWHQSP